MQLFVWNDSGTTLPNNMNWTYCAHIRQATFLPERTGCSSGIFARHFHQHGNTRMTLYQRGHVAVARPTQQITLPMTGNGTIFDFRRSFADGDGIDGPALGVPLNAGMPRAADPPLRSQMPHQLLFQRSARLNRLP